MNMDKKINQVTMKNIFLENKTNLGQGIDKFT